MRWVLVLLLLGAGCTRLFGLEHVDPPPDAPPPPVPEPGGSLATGYYFSCSLHPDATAWCWGRDVEYEIDARFTTEVATPEQVGTATWQSLSARSIYTCGVQTDGSVWCWGTLPKSGLTNDVEMTPAQIDPGPVTAVHSGVFAICLLDRAGEIACRGNNLVGQLGDGTTTDHDTFTRIAEPGPWLTLAVGYAHTCAIKLDGSLWCWGANNTGQLALPDASPVTAPERVGDDLWSDVATGYDSSCAITQTGHLRCWGGNAFGQLGNASTTFSPLPTAVTIGGLDLDGWTRVRASWDAHVCALRSDGSLWCWGRSTHGEAGVEATIVSSPKQLPGVWKDVAPGYLHTCATRDDDTTWCFGGDGYGQLGDGGTSVTTPQQIPGTWTAVATRSDHTCAIDSGQQLWCAGQNYDGALGIGTVDPHQMPVMVPGSWTQVAVGDSTTCGSQSTTTSSGVYCWGLNDHGQLGVGDTTSRTAPVLVTAGTFSSGGTGAHTCVSAGGLTYCWGANDRGQVGDGSMLDRKSPVTIGAGSTIGVGELHTCASTASGAECWGGGSIKTATVSIPTGALGQGSDNADHATPAVVANTSNPLSVAVGWYDSCSIDSTSHARCWGLNAWGELGLGDTTLHSTASILPSTWSVIALGHTHGCGIRTDKSLWCWGSNDRGQRGDPAATTVAPTQVLPGHMFSQVTAGLDHTCAIDTGGGLYCWGANDDGQLANGAAWRVSPVQVP